MTEMVDGIRGREHGAGFDLVEDGEQAAEIERRDCRQLLRASIETDHPILSLYLGEKLRSRLIDDAMAVLPWDAHGIHCLDDLLPTFLRRRLPFSRHPVLADIAEFERLLLRAGQAADAFAIDDSSMLQDSGSRLQESSLTFHPSLQLFTPLCDSAELWRALSMLNQDLADHNESIGSWMIWRNPEGLTEFRPVHPDEIFALRQSLSGRSCESIADALADRKSVGPNTRAFQIYLKSWIDAGLVTGLRTSASPGTRGRATKP